MTNRLPAKPTFVGEVAMRRKALMPVEGTLHPPCSHRARRSVGKLRVSPLYTRVILEVPSTWKLGAQRPSVPTVTKREGSVHLERAWVPQPLSLFGWSLALALVLFIASSAVTAVIVRALGAELRLQDTDVAEADTLALRVAFFVVLGRQVLLMLGIWTLHRTLAGATSPFPLSGLGWWPVRKSVILWAAGAYAGVVVYAGVVSLFDVEWLTPTGTVGQEVTRDPLTLALAGLLALIVAPVSEELLFRGVFFGALSRFGVLVGALVSGLLFALPHLDPGSVIPFTVVGAALALVYYRCRSLPSAIYVHMLFNLVSFAILVFAF